MSFSTTIFSRMSFSTTIFLLATLLLFTNPLSHARSAPKDECYCGLTRDCIIGESLFDFTEGVRLNCTCTSYFLKRFRVTLSQCDCESLCKSSSLCSHYTWFDRDDPGEMGELCLLFSSCDESNHWDSHRHTYWERAGDDSIVRRIGNDTKQDNGDNGAHPPPPSTIFTSMDHPYGSPPSGLLCGVFQLATAQLMYFHWDILYL